MSKGLEEAWKSFRMDADDAKQWIIDNYGQEDEEVLPKDINLVLGFGTNPTRKWWRREESELV